MNNILKNCNFDYIIYIILAIVIIVTLYIFLKDLHSSSFNSKRNNDKNIIINVDTQPKNIKILKYFGGAFCPHSRIGSKAHLLINEIANSYEDIKVEYFWSNTDDASKEEFKKANIKYVPTLTDNDYNIIELKIPNNTDTIEKTEDELKQYLIKVIYDKLM